MNEPDDRPPTEPATTRASPTPLRAAVERTMRATAGSAPSTRERAGELVDEVVRRGREARDELARRGQEAGAELARRGQEATGEVGRRLEALEPGWPSVEERLAARGRRGRAPRAPRRAPRLNLKLRVRWSGPPGGDHRGLQPLGRPSSRGGSSATRGRLHRRDRHAPAAGRARADRVHRGRHPQPGPLAAPARRPRPTRSSTAGSSGTRSPASRPGRCTTST